MDYFVSSCKVKELQAAFFPVQPIPGKAISNQCLQAQLGIERKDLNSEVSLTTRYRCCDSKDSASHFESLLQGEHPNVIGLEAVSQEARWPTECQVIGEKIQHVPFGPEHPEPFYCPTGREPRPKPVGEDSGTVLYRYNPQSATNYFSRSCIGGSSVTAAQQNAKEEKSSAATAAEINFTSSPCYSSRSPSDLCFESRFESGNLGKVIKITDFYYQLHLRKDLYTQKHMQWFYFRITNTKSDIVYRLSIVNLCKEDSLYNEGLRPLLYSTKDAATKNVGWRRCGQNISYYKNDNSSSDEEKDRHTLTFNITFPHDNDTVYLAHCYPYTYTNLQDYLAKIAKDPVKSKYTKLRLLCRSLAGNSVYYLTITSPPPGPAQTAQESATCNEDGQPQQPQNPQQPQQRKKGVVITARVHPGETPSSWIMKGIIDFLTGDSNQAKELRDRFIFKLIPMLNPDGVIVGNNRCSLSGKDLNRQYRTVMRESYPSVWHTKLMIRRLMEECGIALYCDLHAHSRKHNIFIYGCENARRCAPSNPSSPPTNNNNNNNSNLGNSVNNNNYINSNSNGYRSLAEQVFPLMLHKNSADKFSFENCKFHIEKGKEGTGRVVVWLMGIQNSYTMEASLGGSLLGSRTNTHFSTQDYEMFGKAFCETLLDFSDTDPSKERLRNKIITRLMKEGSSADEPTNIQLTDYSSDEGDTSYDSSDECREEEEADESYVEGGRLGRLGRLRRIRRRSCQILLAPEYNSSEVCSIPPAPAPSPVSPGHFKSARLQDCQKTARCCNGNDDPQRRRRRRKAMNLPTLEPGSDLYMSDLDEQQQQQQINLVCSATGTATSLNRCFCGGKENRNSACKRTGPDSPGAEPPRAHVVRPRSLSLGEDVIATAELAELNTKRQRLRRRRRPVRPLRTLSPLNQTNQDVQVKLLPLKRQIWTGVGNPDLNGLNGTDNLVSGHSPLSFGVSKMLEDYQSNSEALLESCSRKLEELKKQKKKVARKKPAKIIACIPSANNNSSPVVEEEAKVTNSTTTTTTVKKKKVKVKRTKATKTNIAEQDGIVLSSETLDSLKLFGTAKLPKITNPAKPKSEAKKKLTKTLLAATITTSKLKPKVGNDNNSGGDSSSSVENTNSVACKCKLGVVKTVKKSGATNSKKKQRTQSAKKQQQDNIKQITTQ